MNFHLLLVDFPCWAVYLKHTSETVVEIQNTLQNLRYSTRICLPWQMTHFQFQSRKYTKSCRVHVWLYCIVLINVYMSCTLVLLRADQVWAARWSVTLGQKSRVDYTLYTVIGPSSSAFEIRLRTKPLKQFQLDKKRKQKWRKCNLTQYRNPVWIIGFLDSKYRISDKYGTKIITVIVQ